jgi:hypothetical protein
MRRVALCWLSDDAFVFVKSLSIPNEDFGRMNKDEIRMFEALFKGVSTLFGLLTIEKSVENPDFIFVHPSFGEHKVWKLLKTHAPFNTPPLTRPLFGDALLSFG